MESVPLKQQTQVQVRVNDFVRSVYNWMAIGLALTGFIAYFVAHNESFWACFFRWSATNCDRRCFFTA